MCFANNIRKEHNIVEHIYFLSVHISVRYVADLIQIIFILTNFYAELNLICIYSKANKRTGIYFQTAFKSAKNKSALKLNLYPPVRCHLCIFKSISKTSASLAVSSKYSIL